MKKILTLGLCLTAFTVAISASTFSSGGLIYTLDEENSTASVGAESTDLSGEVEIPASIEVGDVVYTVNAIADRGFASCWDVTSVTLPPTIEYIGVRGFSHCGITEIALPNGLKTIGEEAFATKEGKGITSITIPASVSDIGLRAFYNDQLTEVVINGDAESPELTIGASAFGGTRSALTRIVVGRSVPPVLGENAFRSSDTSSPVELVGGAVSHYDDYKIAPGWSDMNIVEPIITAVETIDALPADTSRPEYYTLSGTRINEGSPAPGIYIIRQGRTVSKVRL